MANRRVLRERDHKLWDDFDSFLLEKYGTKHTVFTAYVERGLALVLAEENVPGYDVDGVGLGVEDGSTHKKFRPRQLKLMEDFYWQSLAVTKFSDDKLTQFIIETLVIKDPRSIQGHKDFLQGLGWITPLKNTNLVEGTDQVVAWKVKEISQADIEKYIPDIHSPVRGYK